ncbi:MAG: MFS transporter [Parachlamydiales bacterium]|nr:MFS transporter [Parachlamydiales bacterium]
MRNFISALAVAFIDNFGLSLVLVLFAPLILNPEYGFFSKSLSVGTKNVLLGIAMGSFPFFQFFGAPFWGDVGDRWGRRKALIYTLIGTAIGHLLTALAIFTSSFIFLLISRAIAGFFSGNASICMAIVSDISHDAKLKARNFGILTVFWGIGFILSMAIGGSLYFNPYLPFYIAAALTFLGFGIVYFLYSETHKPLHHVSFDWIKSLHEIGKALHVSEMRPFLYILFVWGTGWFINFQWFTPVSMERFSATEPMITKSLVVLGIFWALGGVLLNPVLVKRFSSLKLAFATILVVGCLVALSSLSTTYMLFSVFFTLSALLSPVSLSNLFNLVSQSAPKEYQGKAMGFSQSFFSLCGLLVPLAGGLLADISIYALYPISAIILLLASLLLWKKL